eukprot:TRINITY_DN797_c1_g2_i1.p1 TRINITY_DN797_c1_g2~~TRINITY_DN797_c1_g2_i1.p1  ORF type:complete len:385 (+),score=141.88 TRINITY_DN797_c1_g2_i1:43-1197(+)
MAGHAPLGQGPVHGSGSMAAEEEERFEASFHYKGRKAKAVESSYRMRLLCGRGNEQLADGIGKVLRTPLTDLQLGQFANGESSVKVKENIRGDDIFIIQSTCTSPDVDINTSIMELLLLAHTLRLSSAKRITAIVPYFAYSRQDRKTKPRVPLSACLMAQMYKSVGIDRVITVDLHCGQVQGFFHQTPVDNLSVHLEWANYIERRIMEKEGLTDLPNQITIVSPDAGGMERAMQVADLVQAQNIVTILKRRAKANEIERMEMIGDVKGQVCVIIDDICDTGGTLCHACDLLKERGAKAVYACITHGLFTHPCVPRMNACDALSEIVTTDSIPHPNVKETCPKVHEITLAPLLAEAIERTHTENSMTGIFCFTQKGRAKSPSHKA